MQSNSVKSEELHNEFSLKKLTTNIYPKKIYMKCRERLNLSGKRGVLFIWFYIRGQFVIIN